MMFVVFKRFCWALVILAMFGTTATASPKREVEAQPLLAQIRRVTEAMAFIGQPFSEEVQRQLKALEEVSLDSEVVSRVQTLLEPLVLGEVVIPKSGQLEFLPSENPPKLLEQGWRAFLVKVTNARESTAVLRVDSPGARPLPESPAEEVENRWIDIDTMDRRPMVSHLSGLPLEYRIIQLWAREPGQQRASIAFTIGDQGSPSRVEEVDLKVWNFETDTEGWVAQNHSRIEARGGNLHITSTGGDPFLGAEVKMSPGEKRVRWRAKTETTGMWQVFWWTENRPSPDGGRQRTTSVFENHGNWGEYEVTLPVDDHLIGIRLDPGAALGESEIDWIEISSLAEPGPGWAMAEMPFDVEPSNPVRFIVKDENGDPTVASFVIRDEKARVYPMPSKRLAPDFFFHPQIYRQDGEIVSLPPGVYQIACRRGPESIAETKRLVVGESPTTFTYEVKRWVNPAASGWYSGDHHIHAAGCLHYNNPSEGVHAGDMQRHIMGEDLKVGANLTWGPCFDYQKQFFTGTIDAASSYPYLLRYDIEVSGFGSHQSGHLCLLRLKNQIYPGGESKHHWPTLGLNTLRWAKAQGAITGPAHSAIGLGGQAGRIEGPDGPDGLPNYIIPNYDGIGANEYVVDITHRVPGPEEELVPAVDFISTMNTDRKAEFNMWYHTLNCGFRVRASGETDFPCITGDRVGLGRVYVKQRGRLSYDDWCEGIREGRSYVSDGTAHLMDFAAHYNSRIRKVGEDGSELRLRRPDTLRLTARVSTLDETGEPRLIEAIVNGYPVASRPLKSNGQEQEVAFDIPVSKSSWVALRVFPHAHTNPIFVLVEDKPIAANRRSAEWLLAGVEQCWKHKQRTYDEDEQSDAIAAYDHARKVYREIIERSQ